MFRGTLEVLRCSLLEMLQALSQERLAVEPPTCPEASVGGDRRDAVLPAETDRGPQEHSVCAHFSFEPEMLKEVPRYSGTGRVRTNGRCARLAELSAV